MELLGRGLVDFPPEELVALDAGHETGFGEAVGPNGRSHLAMVLPSAGAVSTVGEF